MRSPATIGPAIPLAALVSAMASQTLPAVSGDKDRSLQEAVSRLTYSPRPGGAEADPIVTAVRRLPAVSAAFAPYPEGTDDRLIASLAARGISQLYTHQAQAFAHVLGGRNVVTITPTASGKTLCYNAPVLNSILQDPSTRALYLFPTKALAQDQLAELHTLVGARDARQRSRDWRLHLRRRHAVRCATRDSRQGARGAQQSRHAARGHPAAPSALGEALREPALRRDRRAARVSRRVRQPPLEHPPPAAARVSALRIGSGVHLLVGHDREPARAGGRADGQAVRARRRERRAARGEVLSLRQPAGRERRARHPAVVPGGNAPRRARVPEVPAAAHRVRAEPAVGRAPHDVSEGCVSRSARCRRRDPRIPRRIPAQSSPRDRTRPARRAGARGRLDQRARARASTSARSTCP